MREWMDQRGPASRWDEIARGLAVVALVALLAPLSALTTPSGPLRAQAALLTQAQAHPDAETHVIVQKAGASARAEARVGQLGGQVTKDLAIINAFAADVPGRAIATLAADADVRWVSLDAPLFRSACGGCISAANLQSAYPQAIGATRLWPEAPDNAPGLGVGVAVVDSGVNPQSDFYTWMGRARIVASVRFNSGWNQTVYDNNGHGSHVAGIIGGDGDSAGGAYIGVAPSVNLVNVKVSADDGSASASSVVAGLQWILNNKARFNIRVVNISLNSAAAQSFDVDPIDAACEILWFNGVVVVAAAGNNPGAPLTAPGNDPFVITVGATDDHGTATLADDTLAPFSASGVLSAGGSKPDLVAPGTNIVSVMGTAGGTLPTLHPANVVNQSYFRMSGTSMAAPMVAGAVALLLQREPSLNPDQVKYRLKATAVHDARWPGYDPARAGAGYLDAYAAAHTPTNLTANTGLASSHLLWTGAAPPAWNSVNWGSVNWGSVNWGSVNWGSVNWGSDSWGSDYWGP
jgi:serine protease AprX